MCLSRWNENALLLWQDLKANYDGRYTDADGSEREYREALTAVDHFGIANAFGLSDMHGNVWEWYQDYWHGNCKDAPRDGSAWLTLGENGYRVLRGGSWTFNPRNCRSAFRYLNQPSHRLNSLSFRVCCSPPRALQ
ncbi:MAG: formylglycine-generating enzyme family protein [Cyanobacteria bacterium P01_F01_bin.86]